MNRPVVYIFDSETQEGISREMNNEEYEQHLLDVARFEEEQMIKTAADEATEALAQAKRAAKAEALAALGLSQEVINLLAD